jgi:hypothetical protein
MTTPRLATVANVLVTVAILALLGFLLNRAGVQKPLIIAMAVVGLFLALLWWCLSEESPSLGRSGTPRAVAPPTEGHPAVSAGDEQIPKVKEG